MDLARQYNSLGLKLHECSVNDTSASRCCRKKRRLLCRPIMLPKVQHMQKNNHIYRTKPIYASLSMQFFLLYILPQPQVLEIVIIHWGSGSTFPQTAKPYSFLSFPFLSFPFLSKKPSHSPLPSHHAQMLQHGFIGVQKPIHAVLYTRLLFPVQAAR